MARYQHYDYGQTKMLPVSYERQILPGTFEHTLSFLIDNKIDLTVFKDRYKNDDTGTPAVRSGDSLKDYSVCALQGHHVEPRDRATMPGEDQEKTESRMKNRGHKPSLDRTGGQ